MKKTMRQPRRASNSAKATPTAKETVEVGAGQTIDLAPMTIKLKSILVPVDFSPPAQKALDYARSFAEQFGATVTLLYVVEPAVYPTELGYVPAEIDTLYRTMHESAVKKLAALAEKQIPPSMGVQTLVRIGQPHRAITEAAKELDVDLIVIATHGYTGLKHTFLGSTTERVVRHAPCPVLTVREREHDFV
jgi:nucleotide-binding universal stress UspA family protein